MAIPPLAAAALAAAAAFAGSSGLAASPAAAFEFHCTGNACRAVTFFDEGIGCTVVTNRSGATVHITQGINQLSYDLGPGETKAPLILAKCYGYYDGGETANYVTQPRR